MLEVKALTKRFDDKAAVKDVSFTVNKGEVLVLLGTSGCGKTTTLKMINRLVEKSSGQVFINGQSIDDKDPNDLRQGIGYVIQETGLFPHLTVGENIAVVPNLLRWPKHKIEKRVNELTELIGLGQDIKDKSPNELSGGQQQRVGLARALAANPSLILLDEPFGALDPITRKEMQKEFIQLEGAINKAMVMVTHDVNEAFLLADKICLMHDGVVQQIGKPIELLFRPANPFVKSFFINHKIELELSIFTLENLIPYLNEGSGEKEISRATSIAEAARMEDENCCFKSPDNMLYKVESVLKTFYDNREQIIKSAIG